MDERHETTEPPGPTAVTSADLGRGWRTAVLRAVLAAVVLLLLAQAVILLAYFAADDPSKPSAGTVARYGGVVFYTFHHVGFEFRVPNAALGGGATPFDISAGGVIAVAAMAGTVLGVWLLARGGRAVAQEVGGVTLARGLHGLKVALPYAVLTLAGSLLLRFKPADGSQTATIHPSYMAAFLWPLALAAVAGFVGGVRSGDREATAGLVPREQWDRRLRGALAGGWRMVAYGLVFAFVGLLVMAVVKPHSTSQYFSSFDQGILEGVLAIVVTLLVLPNMAAWVLFPAMGSCVAVSGPLSICFLSYAHFPRDVGRQIAGASSPANLSLPGAPKGYLLFLLVPLAAVVLGGVMAARKGRATSRYDAAGLGALAGVMFGLLSLVTIVLASITFKISGNVSALVANGSFRIGPELTTGVLFALLWGVVGGALGGSWEGRSLPLRAVVPPGPPPPPAEGPSAPEQPPGSLPAI
jgi:uncharacterized protein DUF6350